MRSVLLKNIVKWEICSFIKNFALSCRANAVWANNKLFFFFYYILAVCKMFV